MDGFKRLRILGCILFVFAGISISAQAQNRPRLYPNSNCQQIVDHTYYSLCYSERHEQARWVIHFLSVDSINGGAKRTNDFREDPLVASGSAGPADYSRSGFDRGHMVPAADMKLSHQAMSETFFMSNMSPQRPEFNRQIWRILEETVRDWSLKLGGTYIVTAPVLEDDLQQLPSGVSIPRWYYKIVYAPEHNQMIAFLMPNQRNDESIDKFVLTVNQLEQMVGIDFFPQIRDDLEEHIEGQVDWDFWIAVHNFQLF